MADRGRGAIIAVEGLSFAGKSTGIRILHEELERRGVAHVVVEWNSVQTVRKVVNWLHARGWLSPVIYGLVQWHLCLAVYIFRMRPALAAGVVVIADRYIHTGLTRDAVNGALSGMLSRLLYRLIPKPDSVLFFALEPHLCLASMRQTPSRSLFHLCRWIKALSQDGHADLVYLQSLEKSYHRFVAERGWIRNDALAITLDGNGNCGFGPGSGGAWIPPDLLLRMDQHIGRYRADLIAKSTGMRVPDTEGVPAMTFDRVVGILRQFALRMPERVDGHAKLTGDLGIDSVNTVKIILAIEEEFGVEIDMSAIRMESFRTIGGVVDLVESIIAAPVEA